MMVPVTPIHRLILQLFFIVARLTRKLMWLWHMPLLHIEASKNAIVVIDLNDLYDKIDSLHGNENIVCANEEVNYLFG